MEQSEKGYDFSISFFERQNKHDPHIQYSWGQNNTKFLRSSTCNII